MAEILQIMRPLALYGLTLAIALPNLWVLGKMLRLGPLPYARKLEIFSFGMLACLPAFYLNTWLLRVGAPVIGQLFHLPSGDSIERTWLSNLFVVAPVEEGLKAVALAVALWRLRRLAPAQRLAPAAPVFQAALLAAGFASYENVLYALLSDPVSSSGFAVIGLRAVTSSLVHCAATAMVGLAIGLRRRYRLPIWLAGTVGLCAAMLIHAGYNVLANLPLAGGQGRLLVLAAAAVLGSSLAPLLAYALGLIGPAPGVIQAGAVPPQPPPQPPTGGPAAVPPLLPIRPPMPNRVENPDDLPLQ